MTETGEPVSPRARLPKVELVTSAMMNSEIATPEGGLIAANHPSTAHPADKMFDLLVHTETDTTGLIAYSLTERTRRDWIAAFRAVQRREPTAPELEAFHLGEMLPMRLAAYRRMADDLIKRSQTDQGVPSVPAMQPAGAMAGQPQTLQQAARSPVTWRYIGFMLLLLVVMAIVFRTAASWLFRA
jgi:hypothetical protein